MKTAPKIYKIRTIKDGKEVFETVSEFCLAYPIRWNPIIIDGQVKYEPVLKPEYRDLF